MEKIYQGRQLIVQGINASIPGSTNLGTFDVGYAARINGLFSTIGSMTLRYQMGISTGNYQVTSSVVINSGGTIFDVLNFGRAVNFTVIAANSQAATWYLQSESVR